MSISIRESIRWLPNTASEPTSTIVLTSPGHRFVDIRLLKSTTNNNNNNNTLDWAFAGISTTKIRDGIIRHSTWIHQIDSRTRHHPEAIIDEGDLFPLDPQGTRTLETGRMVNPATGKTADYEEIWSDLHVQGQKQNQKPCCVVLELRDDDDDDDDEREHRGMAICLGGYFQAVVRMGDRFSAERWLFSQKDGDGGGKWQRESLVGDELWVPRPEQLCDSNSSSISSTLALGDEVTCGTPFLKWRVVERSGS